MGDLSNNNPFSMAKEAELGAVAQSDDDEDEDVYEGYFDEDVDEDEDEDEDEDDYYDVYASKMESYFDNLDCPTNVEVSVQIPVLDDIKPHNNNNNSNSIDDNKAKSSGSSSSGATTSVEETKQFSTFDFVDDIPDHYYANSEFKPTNKNLTKVIQDEWKWLITGLPETIFVRVSESRMELLRAVIVGPPGTPYHDGLFTFDCIFSESYPYEPPLVYYYSSGLRINPNLYKNGKVCLSLLGTWEGRDKCEKWEPGRSTMLQVLVSIQALILNAQPYFNEPGYEIFAGTPQGDLASQQYNETVLILSFKTMRYTMRNPPMHFKDLVVRHFKNRAHEILVACEAYSNGLALPGSEIVISKIGDELIQKTQSAKTSSGGSSKFKTEASLMMKQLLTSFAQNGFN